MGTIRGKRGAVGRRVRFRAGYRNVCVVLAAAVDRDGERVYKLRDTESGVCVMYHYHAPMKSKIPRITRNTRIPVATLDRWVQRFISPPSRVVSTLWVPKSALIFVGGKRRT